MPPSIHYRGQVGRDPMISTQSKLQLGLPMGQQYLSSLSFNRNFMLQSILVVGGSWSIYSYTDCCDVANRSKQREYKPTYHHRPKMRMRRILRCPSLLDDPLQKKKTTLCSQFMYGLYGVPMAQRHVDRFESFERGGEGPRTALTWASANNSVRPLVAASVEYCCLFLRA